MNNIISRKQAGFTLVEMAIVILIASIMITGVISIASTQIEKSRYESTLQKQIALKKSILTFLSRNRRLPCPAVATLAQGAANYGVEAATPGTCLATTQFIAGAARNARGVIPWISLGIEDEMALDGYGRRFTYQVLLSQTAANAASGVGLLGNINIFDSTGGVLINPLDPAAAVILSHGNDGYGAYLPQTGTRMALGLAGYVNTNENTDNDFDFVIKEYSDDQIGNPGLLYDDIILWLKPSEINLELVELGVLIAPNISVNQQLATIRNALLSYVANDNLDPDGGGPRNFSRTVPYADCTPAPDGVADILCVNGVVPWVTLGLDQAAVIDPWSTYITYVVPGNWANVGITDNIAGGPPQAVFNVSGEDRLLGTADDTLLNIDVGEIRAGLTPYGHNFDAFP